MAQRDLGSQVTGAGLAGEAYAINRVSKPGALSQSGPTVVTGAGLAGAAYAINVSKGSTTRVTDTVPSTASMFIADGKTNLEREPNKNISEKEYLASIIQNPLEQYASYANLWTLACIDTEEYNNPEIYRRTGEFKRVIFSSAGRYDKNRVSLSQGVSKSPPEYFINEFKMTSVIAPNPQSGNSNVITFEFKIYEPYSMGLLLQSLQTAAGEAGYVNYLTAPFVLRLDFLGYNELGQILKPGDNQFIKPKYFVLKLTEANFEVTESGSQYTVTAVPYNHQAFDDITNITINDLTLVARERGTVEELLTGPEGLTAALNNIEQELLDEGKIEVADIYDIQFPQTPADFTRFKSSDLTARSTSPTIVTGAGLAGTASAINLSRKRGSATVQSPVFEINDIGKASFRFDASYGGNYPFLKTDNQIDPDTGVVNLDNLVIDPKARTFQFAQRQTIINIINRVIMNSDYIIEELKEENKINGKIRSFTIDVQTEFLDFDSKIGDFAKKITFRIIPYYVSEAVYLNPNALPTGYDEIAKKIVKEYEYIYTGQNVNVLDFDIKIDYLFYTGQIPRGQSSNDANENGIEEKKEQEAVTGEGENPESQFINFNRPRLKRDVTLIEGQADATGIQDIKTQVAESFYQAFIQGITGDLVTVNLRILGDPYWLIDHGIANHFSRAEEFDQITQDGTMNYENGEVYVYLTFKTPVDINEASGLYDFSDKYRDSPFSGIYRVTMCENDFSEGFFRQNLTCLRMIGQSQDFNELPNEVRNVSISQNNKNAIEFSDEPIDIPSSPIDNPIKNRKNVAPNGGF